MDDKREHVNFAQVKDKQEKEEKEWAEKLERERARTLNKVGKNIRCRTPLRQNFMAKLSYPSLTILETSCLNANPLTGTTKDKLQRKI